MKKNTKSKIKQKLLELAADTFASEKVDVFIDDYKALMADPMALHYQRFNGNDMTFEDFIQGCEETRTFFHDRQKYILQEMREE